MTWSCFCAWERRGLPGVSSLTAPESFSVAESTASSSPSPQSHCPARVRRKAKILDQNKDRCVNCSRYVKGPQLKSLTMILRIRMRTVLIILIDSDLKCSNIGFFRSQAQEQHLWKAVCPCCEVVAGTSASPTRQIKLCLHRTDFLGEANARTQYNVQS
eukprot:5071181-Amphidinium_carterae.1